MNRGTGLASLNRYWHWGSEQLPKPGELEYLSVTPNSFGQWHAPRSGPGSKTVNRGTQETDTRGDNTNHETRKTWN